MYIKFWSAFLTTNQEVTGLIPSYSIIFKSGLGVEQDPCEDNCVAASLRSCGSD